VKEIISIAEKQLNLLYIFLRTKNRNNYRKTTKFYFEKLLLSYYFFKHICTHYCSYLFSSYHVNKSVNSTRCLFTNRFSKTDFTSIFII